MGKQSGKLLLPSCRAGAGEGLVALAAHNAEDNWSHLPGKPWAPLVISSQWHSIAMSECNEICGKGF